LYGTRDPHELFARTTWRFPPKNALGGARDI
jgi:hypothetical protein